MADFRMTKKAEMEFGRELRKLAPEIWRIMKPHIRGHEILRADEMEAALLAYSKIIEPWASEVSKRTLESINLNNQRAWKHATRKIGGLMRTTLLKTPVGAIARNLHDRQVGYITTLPLDAGIRAQKLAREAFLGGRRADEVARELSRSEGISARHGMLIARTEVAKANATFTQARAEYAELTHYIWRTLDDMQVRPAHREMANRVFRFDAPPEVEGEGAHGPGEIWNCRCYAEPIVPENILHGYVADVDSELDVERNAYVARTDSPLAAWEKPGATQTPKSIYSVDW